MEAGVDLKWLLRSEIRSGIQLLDQLERSRKKVFVSYAMFLIGGAWGLHWFYLENQQRGTLYVCLFFANAVAWIIAISIYKLLIEPYGTDSSFSPISLIIFLILLAGGISTFVLFVFCIIDLIRMPWNVGSANEVLSKSLIEGSSAGR